MQTISGKFGARRRICVILVDRANYGRMHPVMRAIEADDTLELLTVCAGTMLLERFGKAIDVVSEDGFRIDGQVYMELEGSTPTTMAKSTGMGIVEFSSEFQRLQPDLVLLIGDRYESLAAAIAAVYMNIAVAHVQGGEVSGSIDESARHAITKLAHLHFPATERSRDYILRMGERPDCVFNVGCPSGDYILNIDNRLPGDAFNRHGVGSDINPDDPFLLVIFHPVTTRFGDARAEVMELIGALHELARPTLWIWPNVDAGSDHIAKAIRLYRENCRKDTKWLRLIKNLDPETFQKTLAMAACAVGNSSSFIRDSSFSGTPVVLVGDRQSCREHGANLVCVDPEKNIIKAAIQKQLAHGHYPVENIYGNGTASEQIVRHIKNFVPYRQKTLQYVYDDMCGHDRVYKLAGI
jgi:UDP-hydrolysing UDP-N-acetyl-D-glucosamine 2-epimerase